MAATAAVAVAAAAAPAGAVPPTTEQATITGDSGAAYSGLTTAAGWPRVVRTELAPAGSLRAKKRRSISYFTQLSDFQLADEESPKRVEFLDMSGTPYTAAWRPQEAFGPFVVDQAIRQVRDFAAASPVAAGANRRAPMDFAITTGDSADNQQRNEVEWVVKLLEGGTLNPNSGVETPTCPSGLLNPGEGARYTGVQDYDDYAATDAFYDPDEPTGRWAAWPRYPGILDRAQQPFTAAGLNVPSYVAMGNHDTLTQGNAAENAGYEAVATGCVKPMAPVPLADLQPAFLSGMSGQVIAVPPDAGRQAVDDEQYRELHDTGRQADAHGFALRDAGQAQASAGASNYFAFTPKPGLRMISIDTVCDAGVIGPCAEGNIDDPQFRWIAGELGAAQARGELVMLFGHHPIRSLTADFPDEIAPPCTADDLHGHDVNPGCDNDPRSSAPIHLGPDLQELLLAHPNVIAYVAGHTHEHKVTPFARAGGGGFWGIETSSEIDWPIQSRLLEVMDNRDGTLSIFGTLIDHGGAITTPAPGTPGALMSESTLASIGREMAFNDPQAGGATGVGTPADRNVELLLPDPR